MQNGNHVLIWRMFQPNHCQCNYYNHKYKSLIKI